MGRTLLFFVIAMVAAVIAQEPCMEKPCTKEYNPVSVLAHGDGCVEFSNLCMLENAINCNRVARTVICIKGSCKDPIEVFPCPMASTQL